MKPTKEFIHTDRGGIPLVMDEIRSLTTTYRMHLQTHQRLERPVN